MNVVCKVALKLSSIGHQVRNSKDSAANIICLQAWLHKRKDVPIPSQSSASLTLQYPHVSQPVGDWVWLCWCFHDWLISLWALSLHHTKAYNVTKSVYENARYIEHDIWPNLSPLETLILQLMFREQELWTISSVFVRRAATKACQVLWCKSQELIIGPK